MRWLDWLHERALYFFILLGMMVGLLGAFGRERHEGRRPGGDWWLNRLLLMPFLAGAGTAAAVAFALPNPVAHFVASLLSLMGYSALPEIMNRLLDWLGPKRTMAGSVDPELIKPAAHRPTVDPERVRAPDEETAPLAKLRDVVPLAPNPAGDEALLGRLADTD